MLNTIGQSPEIREFNTKDCFEKERPVGLTIDEDVLQEMQDVKNRTQSFLRLSANNMLHQISTILVCLSFFFFPLAGGGDTIVCAECGTPIQNEDEVENILDQHDLKCPNCKVPRERYNNYLTKTGKNGASNNPSLNDIRLKGGATNAPSFSKRNTHILLESNIICDTPNTSDEEDEELYEGEEHVTVSSACASDVYHPTNARYPEFSNRIKRVVSLSRWSNPFRCDTEEAAEAGLFHPGQGRDLLCHYCGTRVPALNASDDAWIEHARVNRRCAFVKSVKGGIFIQQVTEMYEDCDSVESTILEEELASMERDRSTRFRESQLGAVSATSHPTQEAVPVRSVASTSSSQAGSANAPQPSTSNVYVPQPSTSTSNYRGTPGPYALPPRAQPVSRPPANRQPRVPKRQVQAREVRARLDLEWARQIISMGFSAELVGAVIAEQMIYQGDDFRTFKEMLTAVVDASDMGDSYPVNHYALGLSQNGASASGAAAATTPAVRSPQTTSNSNSALVLSLGASSWTDTSPSSGHKGNHSAPPGAYGINNTATSSVHGVDHSGTISLLETENRELKDKKMCKICFENDANIVFLPCGHLVVCQDCSNRVRDCPLCRRPIQGIIKAYLS